MFKFASVIVVLGLMTQMSQAAPLARPTGEVILTVRGNITNGNGEGLAEFDLGMLDALPQRTTVTETPWYEGQQSFSGPIISDLMAAVGGHGTNVTVTALNDYSSVIPIEDVKDYPIILATRRNGEEMSVRDKGPLFVIYPFEVHPELYNEIYFGRSVWQVKSVLVD